MEIGLACEVEIGKSKQSASSEKKQGNGVAKLSNKIVLQKRGGDESLIVDSPPERTQAGDLFIAAVYIVRG